MAHYFRAGSRVVSYNTKKNVEGIDANPRA